MNSTFSVFHDPPPWREALARLLAQPFDYGDEVYREGEGIGLRLTPIPRPGQTTIDLSVSLFFLTLSRPTSQEREADRLVLQESLADVRAADYHLRVAACRALGQLGDPAARTALQHALQDDHRIVRAAATQALTTLAQPRYQKEDLVGVRLSLWRQVRHVWRPLAVGETNAHGQMRFVQVSAFATHRLHILPPAAQGRGHIAARTLINEEVEALAAAETDVLLPPLPPPHPLVLDDGGSVFCSFHRDSEEQVVVEFRSEVMRLHQSWMQVRVVRSDTHEQVLEEFVPLERDARGIVTGLLAFGDKLDPACSYEFTFEPLVLPPDAT